jgi:phenylalanyl-tRNA synthetase beta chain
VKVLLSWIREFVEVPGTPEEIGARMSERGLALEGIERHGDDAVLDFDVTANRPDCLSIRGIAREIATVYGLPLKGPARAEGRALEEPSVRAPASAGAVTTIPITIQEPDLCRRYVGAIADVRVGPSPDWMQSRLTACGIRPISNVVDITNYVLLELGQPMHAFDLARLRGPAIVVRKAHAGEKMTTLDSKGRTLDADMLVIADAENACAIGGVMGGADSEVSAGTRQIVFESAYFKSQSVRGTSRRLGLRTEASYRFERGADLTGCAKAMERALALLEATGAGKRRGSIIDVYPTKHKERTLVVDAPAIRRLLGMDVPDDETERILASLGFEVRMLGGWQAAAPEAAAPMGLAGRGWQVTAPAWRVDIARPVDVIEEVGRHYGFEHLPTTFPAVDAAPPPSDPRIARDTRVRRAMLAMGFSEAITFAFIESAAAAPYAGDTPAVAIANPLSEKFTTLRPSLVPGLVDAVSHNRRHGRRDVRLFEIGTRFSSHGETRGVGAAWTGSAVPEHWSVARRDVDFFDLKGVVEQIGVAMGVPLTFAIATVPYLVDGRTAEVRIDDRARGVFGQLDAGVAAGRDLPAADAVFVLELNLDLMTDLRASGVRFAKALPRHPSVVRDISILIDDGLSAASVRDTIRTASAAVASAPLVDVREFDRYQGKGIPDGKISLSLRLTFQAPDRTLTDADVNAAMDAVLDALKKDSGAIQR